MSETSKKNELAKLLDGRDGPAILSCRSHVPYPGCWWEPNYWLLKEQELFPLYVSGGAYKAFEFKGTPREVVMRGTSLRGFTRKMEMLPNYDEWELGEIDEFEPNPNNLNTITVILDLHGLEGSIWTCSYCEGPHRGVAKFLGYTGNGGTGIWLTNPTCDDCFEALRWCDGCHCTIMPEDGQCPSYGCSTEEEKPPMHPLDPEEDDEARRMGLDGSKFLGPGEACGPPPVLVVMSHAKETER